MLSGGETNPRSIAEKSPEQPDNKNADTAIAVINVLQILMSYSFNYLYYKYCLYFLQN
jgi:hypothetical protein